MKRLNLLPHDAFLPKYTTFVRTTKTRFVPGSTFTVNNNLNDISEYQENERSQKSPEAEYISKVKSFFRKFRNQFISACSRNVIDREQSFFNVVTDAGIQKLEPRRLRTGIDDWKRISRIDYEDGKPQSAAFGSTFKWDDMKLGIRCFKCWHLHRYCELPASDGSVAVYWHKDYAVGNCSEPLTMAVLDAHFKELQQ